MIPELAFSGRGRPGAGQDSCRRIRLNRTAFRFLSAVLSVTLAGLLLPVSGNGQVSSELSSSLPAAAPPATPEGRERQLRLLEEAYAALKKDYASRTAELVETLERLAESMGRLGAVKGWNEEKKKMLADSKALRDLADAREGQLSAAESSRRQLESDFLALKVEYEERCALLSVAARDLDACDDDRAVLRRDLDRRTSEAQALETNLLELKAKFADLEATSRPPAADSGVSLAALEKDLREQRKRVAAQDKEVAKLKKELDKAKGQVKEQQGAVESLRDERENQAGITKQLVRKVRETTSRLMALQGRLSAMENELKSLKE